LDALNLLKDAGIIEIQENLIDGSKEKSPSTYTLVQNVTRLVPINKKVKRQRIPNNNQ